MAKKIFTDESLITFVDEIKTYTDDAVGEKADINHIHDDRYYTESEVDSKLSEKAKATDLDEWFETKQITRCIDGKNVTSKMITGKKLIAVNSI